ncbi:MAG: hypothetical protein K8R91_03910, partial [Phycisphaerae bacterium]|nr:hypothetical protein [Phycisphaerae bacterium]
MAETLNKKTPRDVLRVVFRRRRLFLLGASLFAIIAMLGAYYLPLKYTGTTIFQHHRDVAAEGTLARGSESFDATRLSMRNDLASRDAVAEVAEEIALLKGLPRDPEGRLTREGQMAEQRIVGDIIKDVKVTLVIRSTNKDRFSVSVTHHDPILAKQIPNTLVRNYKNRLLQAIKERLTASSKF